MENHAHRFLVHWCPSEGLYDPGDGHPRVVGIFRDGTTLLPRMYQTPLENPGPLKGFFGHLPQVPALDVLQDRKDHRRRDFGFNHDPVGVLVDRD